MMYDLTYPGRRLRCGRRGSQNSALLRWSGRGFTIIEILIVVVILAIAAMTAIPMMSSAGSVQVRSVSNMIAADLEYAKSLAITKGQDFTVVFDTSGDSYSIKDQIGTTIWHPVKKEPFYYVIDLQAEGLDRVDITGADFGGSPEVTFNYLGSPDNGGTVSVQGGGRTVIISVEAVTGYITVTN
ncbi:MAG TPA: GspH/FimT family protein [Sedimentisphaerales bacterium]|nr:GspH/FimT family protein [Sedimentisphaerales bacterium]